MAMGKHYGSFAKGFSDSLIAMMRLGMTMQLYEARAQYYRDRGWAATHPKETAAGQKQRELDEQIRQGHDAALSGGAGGGGGFLDRLVQIESGGVNQVSKTDVDSHGLTLAQGGNPSEISQGYFQIQNHPGGTWATYAKKAGVDLNEYPTPRSAPYDVQAKVASIIPYSQWGGKTRAQLTSFVPANDRRTLGEINEALGGSKPAPTKTETAKADTTPDTATPVKPGAEKTKVTSYGGPDVTIKGKTYHTDADGNIVDVKSAKSAQADTPKGEGTPYQVAGPTEALTEEEAQRVQANLKRHLVSPEDAKRLEREATPLEGDTGAADRTPVPPPGSPPISAIPRGPTVAAQEDRFPPAPPFESGFPYPDPPFNAGVRPDAPGLGRGIPATAGARPDVPVGRGLPAPAGARPDAPVTVTPQPIVNAARPDAPVGRMPVASEPVGANFVRPTGSPMGPPMPPPLPAQMGPEGPGRTELPATRTGGAEVNAPVVGGDERRQPATSDADKPAPNAQNVSSPGGARVTPAGNSRFTTIDAPNIDPTQRARMGNPQITALNLSGLWGPNPPLSQRGASAAPSPGPDRTTLPASVAANPPLPPMRPPNMDDANIGVALGSRKGGSIQRFNRGGIPARPTMKYAGAGGVQLTSWQPAAPTPTPYSTFQPAVGQPLPTTQPPQMGGLASTGAYANSQLGYQPFDMWSWLGSQSGSPNKTVMSGQQALDDVNALTPGQQQWYNEQVANEQAAGGRGKWYYNPASYPTTPAAATLATPTPAPAPTVNPTSTTITAPTVDITKTDPTSTTTTGTPGVPNIITAKSYDPNVDAKTGAGFSNTSSTGGTNYSVGSDDTLKTNEKDQISGTDYVTSRKGGPMQRFNRGGIPSRPTMRYATGGGAAASTLLSPNYSGPTAGGGWAGTPYADMSPNQQTWANNQQTLLGQEKANANNPGWAGWAQLSGTPAAIWPTPAPAAPTPIAEPAPTNTTITAPTTDITTTDPTSTTTTGTPGVPNSIQAKSYDPNVDAGTGATFTNTSNAGGTNYSVGSDDTLKTTSNNTITGVRRGGPIGLPQRVTRRVSRYDDGGGVSPSIAGMPPGLAQQGQAPIPPIYYNPATYAAAGAPVGKGVSATSAPVYNAGAIPSLPMLKGGVVAFDDGGGVGGLSDPGLSEMAMMDMQDRQDEAQDQAAPAPPPVPQSDKEAGWYINPQDTSAAAPAAPAAGGAGAGRDSTPPSDPTIAQIGDEQGNPSRGLIGAITSGLHWLGEHLGLVGGAQAHPAIAQDPQTQTNRAQHVNYNPDSPTYLSPEGYDELKDAADPTHQLHEAYANIAGLEQGWKWAMMRGDDATAGRLAASILHYSVLTSQNLSAEAQKALYNGDLKKTVDYINQASDAVPDGRLMHATLSPDGKTVTFENKNLNGQVVWRQTGAAQEVLERATQMGKTGQIQWTALESQAAKYDSTFAEMAKNRQANAVAQGKADADEKAQAEANAQIAKLGSPYDEPSAPATTPALPGPGQPPPTLTADAGMPSSPYAPAGATTPSTPATAPVGDGAGASVAHGAPTGADANAPTAQDQPVDLEHNVAYQNIVARTTPKYKTADGRPIVGGVPMKRPPVLDEVTSKAYAPQVIQAINERWKAYHDAEIETDKLLQADIDGQRRDIGLDVQGQRDLFKQGAADAAAKERDRLTGERQTKEKEAEWAHAEEAPLNAQVGMEVYKDTTPMAVTALLPRYAYDANGTALDPKDAAIALGKAYDLPPAPGQPPTGGLQRANTVSGIAADATTWNTHMHRDAVHDLVDGLARGVYTIEGKPTPVTHQNTPLDQFTVHQKFDPSGRALDPGVTLLLPRQDGYMIASIRQEFDAAKPQQPTFPPAPTSPAAPTPAIPPPPNKPDFWYGGRPPPRPGPSLKLPDWVPDTQIPSDQRQLYPELNQ